MVILSLLLGARAASGPPVGTLLLAGGGALPGTIYDEFIDLAGGLSADIVIIPTAAAAPGKPGWDAPLKARGATSVTVLHTTDRDEASSAAFLSAIQGADAVWFTGGRQWRVMDAYLNTGTETALSDLLARGGVIGGTSAGATIQGSLLLRGDTATNTIMLGDHQQGFGWLDGVAIDQHLLTKNRQFDLLPVIAAHPEVVGIGLDEGMAVVIRGNVLEVIGRSYAAIYDSQDPRPFVLIAPGERYNLKTRATP
ncbi:MAG: cyanophycinase [Myxococcota bacterium]